MDNIHNRRELVRSERNNIYGVPEPSRGIKNLIGLGDALIFHVIKRNPRS